MLESYLLHHPWLPSVIWMVLYTSDYYLTLYGATLYSRQNIIRFDGSYELTPEYQEDVDRRRLVSPAFIGWLIWGAALLFCVGSVSGDIPYAYGILVGVYIIPELGIHARHLENIISYRHLAGKSPEATGSVLWSRRSTYARSSVHLSGLAIFTLAAFLLTGSSVLLGGTIGLGHSAVSHYSSARSQSAGCPKPEEDVASVNGPTDS